MAEKKPQQDTQEAKPKADKKDAGGLRFAEKVEALQKEVEAAQAKVEAAEEKAQENWDKALRALAEVENVRRRAESDVEKAHKFATEKFAQALLPGLDSLEKALEVGADQAELKGMRDGIDMTLKMLRDNIAKQGLAVIDALGHPFDPDLHEAMSMVDDPNHESNTVITVFQTGYTLHGRVIRPARVVVAK